MSPWTNYFIRKMWSLVHYRVVVWAKHDASCFEISVLKLKVTLQCQVCEICFAEHTSRKPEGVSLYFLCTSNNCLKGWSFLFRTFYFDYPFFLQWFEVAVWLKATLVLQATTILAALAPMQRESLTLAVSTAGAETTRACINWRTALTVIGCLPF